MFRYYLKLGSKSLKRNPVLSALMVLALALGIGACMTTLTVYYLMSGDPIPHKSDQLFAVQLDSWDPNGDPTEGPEDVQDSVTYLDAMNLMNAETPAIRQVAMNRVSMVVRPEEGEDTSPFSANIRSTFGTFFNMFDTPFVYGSGWTRAEDDNMARVVVLNQEMNERLFGGRDSVGEQLRMDDEIFTVIGVLAHWEPVPKFYDLTNQNFGQIEDMFIPFNISIEKRLSRNGNTNCWKPTPDNGWDSFLNSECVWIQFWAELPDQDSQRAYLNYLNNYTEEQKALGRFERPTNNFISDVNAWMDVNRVVSRDNQVLVRLSFLFLAVCIINTIGLLLAKFMGKASDVAVRRALGASRKQIFAQNLVEVSFIGVLGGVLGIGFAWLGLKGVEVLYQGYEQLVHMDALMLVAALALAVISSVVAGLLPVWRVSRIAPAGYLKTQ
jgi:putative ABC transport system permease protein